MTALRKKLIEDMQLRGLSTSTQENYVRVVRQLAGFYDKSPVRISGEELHQYFLYLSQVKKVSPSTFQIALNVALKTACSRARLHWRRNNLGDNTLGKFNISIYCRKIRFFA